MRYPWFNYPILGVLVLAIVLSNPLAAHAEDGDRWIVGHWQGELDAGSQQLRIVYHLSVDDRGKLSGTMDVPAQGAYGLAVSEVEVAEKTVSMSFDVPGGGSYEGMLDDSGDRIDGTFTQGSSSLPLVLERADASVALSRRPQQPRPPFPYAVDEVSLSNAEAGIELAGTVTRPRGEGPYPAVVLVSGAGPHDRDGSMAGHKPLLVLADHLARHGIVALRLDDRGVGGSGGDPAAATPADIAGDLLAAVSFLRRSPSVAGDRVGLVAQSQGSLAATLAAAEPDSVAFLVLLSGPGLSGLDQLETQAHRPAGETADPAARVATAVARVQLAMARVADSETNRDVAEQTMREVAAAILDELPPEHGALARRALPDAAIDQIVRQLNRPASRFVLGHDPATALSKVQVPVLALFGGSDRQTPFDPHGTAVAAALKRGGNRDAAVEAMSGLNHLLQVVEPGSAPAWADIEQTLAPRALARISGWIGERFSAREESGRSD